MDASNAKDQIRQYTIDKKGQPRATTKLAQDQLQADMTGEALDMTGGDVEKPKKFLFGKSSGV